MYNKTFQEDGQSDLESLLATFSGIIANLSVSRNRIRIHYLKTTTIRNTNRYVFKPKMVFVFQGDGIDLNSLIASGIGLFAGLLVCQI